MRFHPRHYVLIGVIVLLGVWNFARLYRAHHAPAVGTPEVSEGSRTDSPGWQAFDHAAGLRDAPEAQFTPALNALRTQTESSTGPEAADLRACQMWLMYYRHNVPMAGGKANDWAMLATGHVQSCKTNHRDIGR